MIRKSPGTVLYRGRQEASLKLKHLAGGWQRMERKLKRWARSGRATEWVRDAQFSVLAPDAMLAVREAGQHGVVDRAKLIELGDRVLNRDIRIFEVPLPRFGPWPWHEDWRYGHSWAPTYFRDYVYDAPREQPYDVKFPWELSRLTFLQRLVQADLLSGERHRTKAALGILRNWKQENPLAHSVNWYPMEAAMRGIGLCLVSDMTRQSGCDASDAEILMELLAQHGEFVMRTIELTDNAGNHYIAELVALLLLGRALRGYYRSAKHWSRFAEKRLGREITRQFLPDGVNFEKSTAYHRLVLELCLLGSVALAHDGKGLTEVQSSRLRAAARYNAAFMRPDHQCPLIGDSDDALVFTCDDYPVRDHRPVLGLAAIAFGDAELKAAAGMMSTGSILLFGYQALSSWRQMPDLAEPFWGHHEFEQGGMVIAKNDRHYLIMDIGEVGQNGTGGHGHNDILSFELFISGRPIIVDPGSYLYSGDFAAHDHFRSTRSHNGLMIDNLEIAPFTGKFRIADQARPVNVQVEHRGGHKSIIQAGHTGYQALSDSVSHERTLTFDRQTGSLDCRDRLRAEGSHQAVRRLHFAPELVPILQGNCLQVEVDNGAVVINWDSASRARLVEGNVSPRFGQLEPSLTLEIESDISQESNLSLEIRWQERGPARTEGKTV